MTRKNYTLIPLLALVILIPQLLFLWLVPRSADSYWLIWRGFTVLTVGIPVALFIACWRTDLRRTGGLAVISGILEMAAIVLTWLLLLLNASHRTVTFVYLLMTMTSLLILIPMIDSVLNPGRTGAFPSETTGKPSDEETQKQDGGYPPSE